MVFQRYNSSEPNPNPHINFITALKDHGSEEEAKALKLLRALAAQLRPVMKKHGMEINSFEEYEHNNVFLGRNWEAGETIELVLRRKNGSFYPESQLIGVFCHELSHIHHMHHGPSFWACYRQLHSEVKALRNAHYYGDGFWSSGRALQDETQEDKSAKEEDLPEYLCGGAHSKPPPRKAGSRKRRVRQQAGPSNQTGAQVQKKRKAGTRVKGNDAFKGEGRALNADEDEGTRLRLGSGFRKQAGSKRARIERAAAIEARLKKIQDQSIATTPGDEPDVTEDEEYEVLEETDAERRRMMSEAMDKKELDSMKTQTQLKDFWVYKRQPVGSSKEIIDLSDEEDNPQEILKRLELLTEKEVDEQLSHLSKETEPPNKAETDISSGEWACYACTFANTKPLGLQCEICGTERRLH